MLNQALGSLKYVTTQPETDVLVVGTKASTTVLTYLQPSANLQSP